MSLMNASSVNSEFDEEEDDSLDQQVLISLGSLPSNTRICRGSHEYSAEVYEDVSCPRTEGGHVVNSPSNNLVASNTTSCLLNDDVDDNSQEQYGIEEATNEFINVRNFQRIIVNDDSIPPLNHLTTDPPIIEPRNNTTTNTLLGHNISTSNVIRIDPSTNNIHTNTPINRPVLAENVDEEDTAINLIKIENYGNKDKERGSVSHSGVPNATPPLLPVNWQTSKVSIHDRLSFLLMNSNMADVYFIVGGGGGGGGSHESSTPIPAHKFVLSIGSAVFYAMFNSPLSRNNVFQNQNSLNAASNSSSNVEIVHLTDIEPEAFRTLLCFLYTDKINVTNNVLRGEYVLSTLYAAKKYGVLGLEKHCIQFLEKHLTPLNALTLLMQARLYDEHVLTSMCLEVIDTHCEEALSAPELLDLDVETLLLIVERDGLNIREAKLFQAIVRWSGSECKRQDLELNAENRGKVLTNILDKIRFPLMSPQEFAEWPAQSGLLTDKCIISLFLHLNLQNNSNNNAHSQSTAFLSANHRSQQSHNHHPVPYSSKPRAFQDPSPFSSSSRNGSSVSGVLKNKRQLFSASRFAHVDCRWGYSGYSDKIRFSVDRCVVIAGFGLYGSMQLGSEYLVNLQLVINTTTTSAPNSGGVGSSSVLQNHLGNVSASTISSNVLSSTASSGLLNNDSTSSTGVPTAQSSSLSVTTAQNRLLASTNRTFICDGSKKTYPVLFKTGIPVEPDFCYTAKVTIKGTDSYYGTKGMRSVLIDSSVKVNMRGASSSSRTNDHTNSDECILESCANQTSPMQDACSSKSTTAATFRFSYASGNNNGTSVDCGQIPEILFYFPPHNT